VTDHLAIHDYTGIVFRMTVRKNLQSARINLLDVELLLAHVLTKDRSWLFAHSDAPLSGTQQKEFDEFVLRRKNHEPMAYILNEKEFYGRNFFVDRRVLIPRPSTETLIDVTKQFLSDTKNTPSLTRADTGIVIFTHLKPETSRRSWKGNQKPETIIDIGTGSGCIAITLALEIPDIQILATDISESALEVADINARQHKVSDRITFLKHNISRYQLPVTNYQLPITSYQLPVTNYQLPVTNYQLPITSYQLPVTNYQLPITSYQLPVTNYQLPVHHSSSSLTPPTFPSTRISPPMSAISNPRTLSSPVGKEWIC
jgi:HemK-like putative methylase